MAVGGLLRLWKEWGIQVLVLASFALQVLLFFIAGIRRRSSSGALRISLWLAYLLADSTAIYTLGHLSIASSSREHQLVAFWAPFLLLHLGGPDNITAYALEDNSLWLRHLQTFSVQVLGASYVVYKYILAGSGIMLCLASLSMFLAGLLKYGERIWSLKCANMGNIRSSMAKCSVNPEKFTLQGNGEEEILLRAHSQLYICKSVFTGTALDPGRMSSSGLGMPQPSTLQDLVMDYTDEDACKSVEMELSLMYDLLYTKAPVIHTRFGFCIHFIALFGTVTAFLLFGLSIRSRGGEYSRVDVIISYVLLAGALLLEAISLCRAVLSTWTCYFLFRRKLKWLHHALTCIRQLVHPASRRLWKGSIGQYNLFQLCTRDTNEIRTKLAAKMGLQHWWNKLHFAFTFSADDSLSIEDLKALVLEAVKDNNTQSLDSRGSDVLSRNNVQSSNAAWSFKLNFEYSILVWHIATNLYICNTKDAHSEQLTAATKVLSNYMMFLLVVKPDMLPGRPRQNIHVHICKILDKKYKDLGERNRSLTRWNLFPMFKGSFHCGGPSHSNVPREKKLAQGLLIGNNRFEISEHSSKDSKKKVVHDDFYIKAIYLAEELLAMKSDIEKQTGKLFATTRIDTLELIFKVWVEMMLYAADHCSRESHARHLSNGGEFSTIMWLLERHRLYPQQLHEAFMDESYIYDMESSRIFR